MRVNAKKRETGAAHPDRQLQFETIQSQKQVFAAAGWPIISVDTKKKELIGNFKNAGRAWGQEAEAVNVHDFPHDALMRARLGVNFDIKLLEFHQLSWQGHFSSSGESALIPGELVKEEHPLINRVIAKKPTA